MANVPMVMQVGPLHYSVMRCAESDEVLARAARMGESDHYECIVRIYSRLPKQQLNETFWHELCHCIDYVMLNGKLEEDEIACFARGLYQVVKQLGVEFCDES